MTGVEFVLRVATSFRSVALAVCVALCAVQGAQADPQPDATAAENTRQSEPAGAERGIAAKAIDKVKEAALAASDTIFGRVPCRAPTHGIRSMGTLPHVAGKLAAGKPVTIIAFGSSSTAGFGSSKPEFTYPNRLGAQLRRQYPGAVINVINAGQGGEDAPEMMTRIKTAVLDANPDLVIWQVGTNAVMRNLDTVEIGRLVDDGVGLIKAANADLVLVDPQYTPRVNERSEGAGRMVQALRKIAELRHVGIFPRFEVMREWHEGQQMAFDKFVIADGLHMNDWGYACFAQLLGDDIVRSVGQIKLGVSEPRTSAANRPM